MKLVLATRNKHKIDEMLTILGDLEDLECVSLARFPEAPEVDESGRTLPENAVIKVRQAVSSTGLVCLAEDTGLEIDALGGRPGVRSARFAGEKARYEENVTKVLEMMRAVPEGKRTARFRSVVAIMEPIHRKDDRPGIASVIPPQNQRGDRPSGSQGNQQKDQPDGQPYLFEGICPGRIIAQRRGTAGFGYDPIFVPDGFQKTFAEMEAGEKNRISHRALALAAARKHLVELMSGR